MRGMWVRITWTPSFIDWFLEYHLLEMSLSVWNIVCFCVKLLIALSQILKLLRTTGSAVAYGDRKLDSTKQDLSLSQGCDLPEQSTVHVVLPPSGSSSSRLLPAQERPAEKAEGGEDSLTRPDLSSPLLPTTSCDLAVILAGCDGGRSEEPRAEAWPADDPSG